MNLKPGKLYKTKRELVVEQLYYLKKASIILMVECNIESTYHKFSFLTEDGKIGTLCYFVPSNFIEEL